MRFWEQALFLSGRLVAGVCARMMNLTGIILESRVSATYKVIVEALVWVGGIKKLSHNVDFDCFGLAKQEKDKV